MANFNNSYFRTKQNSRKIIQLKRGMQNQSEVKIFVFHYKPDSVFVNNPKYIHIWAGKNGVEKREGFIGDDTGENISNKNRYYSELTGLYWVWKNMKSDIIGSCHYRRYFTTAKIPLSHKLKRLLYFPAGLNKKRFGLIYTNNLNFWKPKVLSEIEVTEIFKNYDAVLPVARKLKYSVEGHYSRYHNIDDLRLIEKILKVKYPQYLKSYNAILKGNTIFANNMFILKWDMFDELMNWLFSILFKFEEEINLDEYKDYQERIFGFLSERLITIWIHHNNIKYKELPLIYFKKLKSKLNA